MASEETVRVLCDEEGRFYVPATAEQQAAIARALFGEWEATHGAALTPVQQATLLALQQTTTETTAIRATWFAVPSKAIPGR